MKIKTMRIINKVMIGILITVEIGSVIVIISTLINN